jgi:hypothetical protein
MGSGSAVSYMLAGSSSILVHEEEVGQTLKLLYFQSTNIEMSLAETVARYTASGDNSIFHIE